MASDFDFVKLDMDQEKDREVLKRCYQKSNPFSALPMNGNYGLLMFYCSSYMKDCVDYSPQLDTVCVATQSGGVLACLHIFGTPPCTMEDVISLAAGSETKFSLLGFPPKHAEKCTCAEKESEETLFVLQGKDNIFVQNKVMFPALSHA